MIYTPNSLAQRAKQLLIGELRYYFKNVSAFGFGVSPIKMPIVREAFSLETRVYPLIVVKILHEESKNLGIGDDFVQDVWSDDQLVGQKYLPGTENFKYPVPYRRRVIAERWGYMADVTFNIQIMGDTVPVRNRVVEEVINAIRFYQRKSLQDNGIQLMRISQGEETDYPLNKSEKIYIANLNCVVNAEMYFDQKVASVTSVHVVGDNKPSAKNPHMDPNILQPGKANLSVVAEEEAIIPDEAIDPPNE
jgi:hypothetical protein